MRRQKPIFQICVFASLAASFALGAQPAPSAAAPLSATLSADRTEILPGERIRATLEIVWNPAEAEPKFFAAPDEIGDFELLEREKPHDTENQDGSLKRTIRLSVTAFEIGTLELGPLEVAYTPVGSEESQKVATETISVTLLSAMEQAGLTTETAAVRPVKPPFSYPRKLLYYIVGLVILLLLLAIVFFLARYLVRRFWGEAPPPPPPPPLPDPDEEALRALAELEMTGAIQRESAKTFYTRLSYILRRYLGRRYRFDALEMTSSELLDTVRAIGLSSSLLKLLEMDARESDSVKFARHAPAKAKRVRALERVREIVMRTRPVAQTPDEETNP